MRTGVAVVRTIGGRPAAGPVSVVAAVLAASLLLGVGVARADEPAPEDPRLRSGAYLGLGGVYSVSNFSGRFSTDTLEYGNTLGVDARGGYRFGPHLALEGQFQWNSDFDQHVVEGGRKTGQSIATTGFTVNAVGYWPVGPVHPYVVGGLGFLRASGPIAPPAAGFQLADSDETAFAARVGAGFETWVTDHLTLAMGLTYVVPTADIARLQHLAWDWGFRWHF